MRYERNSIWGRWDIDKLCVINDNTNTNMYISKLGISKVNDTAIPNNDDRYRILINRGIYSNGCTGVLYILRGGVDTNVLYNRGMRGKRAEDNSSVLLFLLHIIRVSSDANKYNVHI